MIQICISALLTGFSTGIYCLSHCLPVYLAFLFSTSGTTYGQNAKKLICFLSGRFFAYILVGTFAGFIGMKLKLMPLTHIGLSLGYVILGIILFKGVFRPAGCKGADAGKSCIKYKTGAALGFFTGISLCPPMMLAVTYVVSHANVLKGIIYFMMFFVGTSVYFLPFVFLKSTETISKLCRYCALIIAAAFIILGVLNISVYSINYYKINIVGEKTELQDGTKDDYNKNIPKSSYQETTEDRLAMIRRTKRRNTHATNKLSTEAMYYKKLEDNKIQCTLCPHFCLLKDGQTGKCKVRSNIAGDLHTLVMGKIVAAHTDPIEKKPLYHFFPDTDAFSIATAGCNLSCKFCQNWEISQSAPKDIRSFDITPEEVVAKAIAEGAKSIAYTYTEPTIFYEYMLATAKLAKENGIKNVMVSAGYINQEPLENLCPYIDAANIDLKAFSDDFYKKYSGARLEPVLNTLKTLHKNKVWLEITNLIIPDLNDSDEEIEAMCKWIAENLGTGYPLHFSRFFPKHRMKEKAPTPVETLIKARNIAKKAGIQHVYIGNVILEGTDDTICPACKATIIARDGYLITKYDIKEGKCGQCGETISGVFDEQ